MKQRNSSIELLKIIAMIFITISHSVPFYGNHLWNSYIPIDNASTSILNIILVLFRCLGEIGNIIFLICSFWFMLESNTTKKEKIINIIVDSFFISIIWCITLLSCNLQIPKIDLIKQLAPITFGNNWFIGTYILIYCIHQFLNIIINNIDKKTHLRIVIFMIFIYSFIQFLLSGKFDFNGLIGFIMLYFIVGYMKKYLDSFCKNKKINLMLIVLGFCLNTLLIITTNCLGLMISAFSDKMLYWNGNIANPFYIIIGIGFFNIFNCKCFNNRVINYIAKLSLIYYMIHENMLFREYMKPYFYKYFFQYNHILFWVALEFLLMFILGISLSALYKETIQKLTKKIVNKICLYFNKRNKLETKLLNIH